MVFRGVLTALALLLAGPAAALSLDLDTSGLDADRASYAQALVERTLTMLPPQWQADSRAFSLRFDADLPAGVVGHHRLGRLRLAPSLLDAPAPDEGIDPAQAALIHEITHALDRGGGHWSADPVFRRLSGWQDRRSNTYSWRLPDAQVLQSPAESLAVHAESFLLDRSYRCRQPALAAWLAGQWGPPALPASDCPAALPFVATSGQGASMTLESIDPARVWAVDYLLAGSGGGAMSRFGHSMLRLVICAPGREPGPRCRMDLSHHRVLSYRAFVDDVQISSWRGLTGAYPSRLFVLPLDQVIDEYTRVELRDLQAFPLALDRAGVAAVLEAAAQAHWRHDGAYRFIDNNCAVETGRLLDTALMAQTGTVLPPMQSITPKGVLRALRRQGWVDSAEPEAASAARAGGEIGNGPMDQQADAVRSEAVAAAPDGLYFPSARAEYRLLLARLQEQGQIDSRLSLESWLDADAARRGEVPATLTLEQAAAWLVLERAALRRAEHRALARLKRQLGRQAGLDAAVQDWRQWLGRVDAPGALPIGGYGLPQPQELARADQWIARISADGQQRWIRLRTQAEAALPMAESVALAVSRGRVAALGQRLRGLAAP